MIYLTPRLSPLGPLVTYGPALRRGGEHAPQEQDGARGVVADQVEKGPVDHQRLPDALDTDDDGGGRGGHGPLLVDGHGGLVNAVGDVQIAAAVDDTKGSRRKDE